MDGPLVLAGGRTPVGPAPKGSGKVWSEVWRKMIAELPWLDRTHRLYMEEALDIMRQREEVREFFALRKEQMVKQNQHPAAAYLTDDGARRHPLAVQGIALSDAMRKVLTSLGASPQSQMKLVAQVRNATGVDSGSGDVTDYFDS